MDNTVSIQDLKQHADQQVSIQGWLHGKRSSGKIAFLIVRDGTGQCQCTVEAALGETFEQARAIPQESSLIVTGKVHIDERAPGGAEIHVTEMRTVHAAQDGYPISRKAHGVDFLLNNRHLWLRAERQTDILRIRHTIITAVRSFFDEQDFTLIDTPILSPGAAEGAGTLFALDYFGDEVYLAQTGQLYLESAAMALGKVYCFGPTFRAEKSKTRRHLTEFWMVEPEMAYAELDDVVHYAEALVTYIVKAVLEKHRETLIRLGRDVAPLEQIEAPFPRVTYTEAAEMLRSDKIVAQLEEEFEQDKQRLQNWIEKADAMEEEKKNARKAWQQEKLEKEITELRDEIRELDADLQNRPEHIQQAKTFEWGRDFGGNEETILSRQFDRPLIITEYPRDVKAFYMKQSPGDPKVVLNVDMLAPEGYGEIIGGSQREDDLDILVERMKAENMDTAPYEWYLDLRRYGSVPHGGFGLGIERTVSWICGLKHVRETIPFPRLMGRMYP